jgi:hypothetical protein
MRFFEDPQHVKFNRSYQSLSLSLSFLLASLASLLLVLIRAEKEL